MKSIRDSITRVETEKFVKSLEKMMSETTIDKLSNLGTGFGYDEEMSALIMSVVSDACSVRMNEQWYGKIQAKADRKNREDFYDREADFRIKNKRYYGAY